MSELSSDVAARIMLNLTLIWSLEVGVTPVFMWEDERDEVKDNLHLFASGRCEDLFVKSACRQCMS